MRQSWLTVMVVGAALAVGGCGSQTLQVTAAKKVIDPPVLECKADGLACEIPITAEFINGNCVLTVPGQVEVAGAGLGDRTVRWILNPKPASRRFRFDSVKPVGPNAGFWPGEFIDRPSARENEFEVINKRTIGSKDRLFDYEISVSVFRVFPPGFVSCGVDPVIVNKG